MARSEAAPEEPATARARQLGRWWRRRPSSSAAKFDQTTSVLGSSVGDPHVAVTPLATRSYCLQLGFNLDMQELFYLKLYLQ